MNLNTQFKLVLGYYLKAKFDLAIMASSIKNHESKEIKNTKQSVLFSRFDVFVCVL